MINFQLIIDGISADVVRSYQWLITYLISETDKKQNLLVQQGLYLFITFKLIKLKEFLFFVYEQASANSWQEMKVKYIERQYYLKRSRNI